MSENEQQGGIQLLLGAWADFGQQQQERHKELLGLAKTPKPIRRTFWGQIATSGSGINDLIVPSNSVGPASGKMWVLRVLYIGPANPRTAFAGTAILDIYAGSEIEIAQPDVTSIVAVTQTIPYANSWSHRQITLYHGDQVYALLNGVTNTGLQIIIAGEADEYNVADVEAMHA